MNQANTNKQSLEEKIVELEDTLAELKKQLKKQTEADQHAAIDQLEQYLDQIDNKYQNLQDFWQILREELSEMFSKKTN